QTASQLNIRQEQAEVEIRQPKADLQMKSKKAKLSIDQSKAFAEANLKSALKWNKDIAASGRQHASSGTARRARQGNQLIEDRKSTRLNSSHVSISYAVFCLKKKKKKQRHRDIEK